MRMRREAVQVPLLGPREESSANLERESEGSKYGEELRVALSPVGIDLPKSDLWVVGEISAISHVSHPHRASDVAKK